jgi:glycosyltransferase involved in cell wall biosynthesis
MRVVIATDSFPPRIDGVADTSATIAQLLSRRGHDVLVIAPAPGPSDGDGYSVVRIRSIPFPLYPEFRLAAPPAAISTLLRRYPPDATLVLTPGVIGLWVVQALSSRSRLVHIYSTDILHYARTYGVGFLGLPVERTLRWVTQRAGVTLCPTDLVRAELALRGHQRLAVWGRGVDTDLFNPERADPEMRWRLAGGEPHKPLILYVGRLAREKRLFDLLDAARQIRGARFALVGDGPQRDLLERRFAEIPSVFTGYLRGVTLASAFASADIFAFPSDSETFGQVVLQAMACGLPPVVVEGSAPAEFVPKGVAGIHVRPRSPADLAMGLSALADDVELRRSLAARAHEHASRFSWAALIERLEALLTGEAGAEFSAGTPRLLGAAHRRENAI